MTDIAYTPTAERDARLRSGIAAYAYERQLLLRFLRRHGSFTEYQFDHWFYRSRRSMSFMAMGGICGDSFILGGTGHTRDAMLHLLQLMICLREVDATAVDGTVTYRLSKESS